MNYTVFTPLNLYKVSILKQIYHTSQTLNVPTDLQAKGMKSFVFNTASGISSMVYRIFRATMKGMSLFTADRSFIILRHQIRQKKILSFRQGLYIGGKYYFKALLSAFTSIYTKPCTLAKERGFIGAISGIYVVSNTDGGE